MWVLRMQTHTHIHTHTTWLAQLFHLQSYPISSTTSVEGIQLQVKIRSRSSINWKVSIIKQSLGKQHTRKAEHNKIKKILWKQPKLFCITFSFMMHQKTMLTRHWASILEHNKQDEKMWSQNRKMHRQPETNITLYRICHFQMWWGHLPPILESLTSLNLTSKVWGNRLHLTP